VAKGWYPKTGFSQANISESSKGKPMKILETTRLILRHLLPDDLDSLYALYCDPDVEKYIPDAPLTYEETREELEWFLNGHLKHPELGLWATIHKGTGKFIGRCGLLPWTIDGQYEVEVAYLLAKEVWGQGLGSEAARAIADYGFEHGNNTPPPCRPPSPAARKLVYSYGQNLYSFLYNLLPKRKQLIVIMGLFARAAYA
jgi:RimJ/RimL family protein N-acetyltransferase